MFIRHLSLRSWKAPLGVAFLLLTAVLFGACESAEPNIGATIDDITGSAEEYFGQTVTVSGEVERSWVPGAFEMGGLLVIVPSDVDVQGGGGAITTEVENDVAQVTGTVTEYVVADIEAEYGVDLDADIDYSEGQPAVIAETIYFTPTRAANLTGYPAAAVNLRVGDVISDRVFFVDLGTGDRLPVYLVENQSQSQPVEGQVDINAGQEIAVTGSLQPMPSASQIQSQWGLSGSEVDQLTNYMFYFRAQQAVGVPNTAPGPSN